MTNNHKVVGEAAKFFGGNDDNNVDEVNTLENSDKRQIGGHSSGQTTNLGPPGIPDQEYVLQNTTSSAQNKGRNLNPSTTPTPQHHTPQNVFIVLRENNLRSHQQFSSTTLTEKSSMEIPTAWQSEPQSRKDYYHAPAVEKSYLKAQSELSSQQQSGQNQRLFPQQSNSGFSLASPADPRQTSALPGQDFYLYHSEIDAPPTPTSIPNSPSAGPLMPVLNSFDPDGDEDMADSSTQFFPPLSSIQRRPTTISTSSLRNSYSRNDDDDDSLPEEGFGFSLF